MAGQRRGPINGLDPLVYSGGLPNMVIMDREPTPKDFEGYFLGHWWIIPQSSDDSAPTEEIWVLVSKRNNISKWKRIHGGSGPVAQIIIGSQVITATGAGTYTPTAGMKQVYVECVGGGSSVGSVGTVGVDAGTVSGGASGGYCAKLFSADDIGSSISYSVGAGGVPQNITGVGFVGSAGATTFGSLLSAGGGTWAGTGSYIAAGGVATGGDININGHTSGIFANIAGVPNYQQGGSTMYGLGGQGFANGAASGVAAAFLPTGYGSAPGGRIVEYTAFGSGSWNGKSGLIKITEYFV